ncbi:hypothetical protein DFJ63DRAFT_183134 [Scheffersomyces coipomensis]|uniref:uncharacterized protein n=1 Tax=Scheffersomyces coipomensis TaxID=1788519 RepID=UPI00315D5154
MNSSELDDMNSISSSSKPESRRLLDSFHTPESEYEETKLKQKRIEDLSEDLDDRLGSASSSNLNLQSFESASSNFINNENDVNNHIPTASSSSSNIQATTSIDGASHENNGDLESQRRSRRLTTRQRILNVIHHLVPIKQTYERINNGLTTGRMQSNSPGSFVGQGTDGVFRNLMAKPDTDSATQEQETHPPTYEEAAADATPEYWESTVISPMYEDEVFVEGLPVGNIANFAWNALVTVAFQFVGFVLCYLLHTSHAAKHGSRAGLGITFVIYGYQMTPANFGHSDRVPDRFEPESPNQYDIDKFQKTTSGVIDNYNSGLFQQHSNDASSSIQSPTSAPYIAYGTIAFGLFIIIKAVVDYYKVKQIEKVILSPPNQETNVTSTTFNVENYDEPNPEHEDEPTN